MYVPSSGLLKAPNNDNKKDTQVVSTPGASQTVVPSTIRPLVTSEHSKGIALISVLTSYTQTILSRSQSYAY